MLVGDAAAAPSFLTGQGTSVALVSAGDAAFFPRTAEALARRDAMVRGLTALPSHERPEHSAITLDEVA
uniref:hypothetical protein n=1 Tax=Herbidospora sakaeratensis TaxID=564415 RepID=UPI000782994A|nr:hypothetical protein [Herbidospora sakaeratensis]